MLPILIYKFLIFLNLSIQVLLESPVKNIILFLTSDLLDHLNCGYSQMVHQLSVLQVFCEAAGIFLSISKIADNSFPLFVLSYMQGN